MSKTFMHHCESRPAHQKKSLWLAFAAFATFALTGCAEKKAHARPWATSVSVRPVRPSTPVPVAPQIEQTEAPELTMDLPEPPPDLALPLVGPARPRVVPPPNPEAKAAKPSSDPIIAPQMSAEETAQSQQQVNDSLGVAQHNLQLAGGRSLNATQADLVSKVQGFIEEAQKAASERDWQRAVTVAKKAQVLSQELAGSL